ncbi:hypothetical protein BG006_009009, partial [Podila minutissima]
MLAASQKFKFSSTEKELDLVSPKASHEPLFVYVDDVLKAFKIRGADSFKADGRTITCMRDDNGTMYHPKRIPCHPGCVIQVVYETPQSDKSNVLKDLDSSEPVNTTLSRHMTIHINSQLKTLNSAVELANHSGYPLHAKAMQDLIKKHLGPSTNVEHNQQKLEQDVGILAQKADNL